MLSNYRKIFHALLSRRVVNWKYMRLCEFSDRSGWEPHPKGGEYAFMSKEREETDTYSMIRNGVKLLPRELLLLKDELKEKFYCDSRKAYAHGDYEIVWDFKNQEKVQDWIVSSDSDARDGKSFAFFDYSDGLGMFHGNLNREPVDDGKAYISGYTSIRSPYKKKSFQRLVARNWKPFTHLVIRCRGDGRAYMLHISMKRYFDVAWHDAYNFPLYTRGGPYWQIAKIPFNKFYRSHKGRVQDRQSAIPLADVNYLAISCMDNASGPFRLCLDYIGILVDSNEKCKFDYELYKPSPGPLL